MLINSMGESFCNVYVYQIITFYTLNILQFCQLYLYKSEKNKLRAIVLENVPWDFLILLTKILDLWKGL